MALWMSCGVNEYAKKRTSKMGYLGTRSMSFHMRSAVKIRQNKAQIKNIVYLQQTVPDPKAPLNPPPPAIPEDASLP